MDEGSLVIVHKEEVFIRSLLHLQRKTALKLFSSLLFNWVSTRSEKEEGERIGGVNTAQKKDINSHVGHKSLSFSLNFCPTRVVLYL